MDDRKIDKDLLEVSPRVADVLADLDTRIGRLEQAIAPKADPEQPDAQLEQQSK